MNCDPAGTPSQRAITGLSMGGHGGLWIGLRHPELFRNAGATSGGVDIRPFPKGAMDYVFHKFVGVGAFTRKALDFYHNTPRGPIEKIEENDSFRFIENHKPIYYYNCHCKSLSVDNRKDIAGVEAYFKALQK